MDRTITEIAIFGAGGFGMELAMMIKQINEIEQKWKLIGFFDDGIVKGNRVNGVEVLGGVEELNAIDFKLYVALAIGSPRIKMAVIENLKNPKIHYPILIHPYAIMGDRSYLSIGEGSIVCAGCIVTTKIIIGRHVFLNLACTVGHETTIGDYSAFMPGCNISGEVNIGKGTFWGTGAKIINQRTVGNNVTVGAGAVILDDLPSNVTAVGVPARVVKGKALSAEF